MQRDGDAAEALPFQQHCFYQDVTLQSTALMPQQKQHGLKVACLIIRFLNLENRIAIHIFTLLSFGTNEFLSKNKMLISSQHLLNDITFGLQQVAWILFNQLFSTYHIKGQSNIVLTGTVCSKYNQEGEMSAFKWTLQRNNMTDNNLLQFFKLTLFLHKSQSISSEKHFYKHPDHIVSPGRAKKAYNTKT